MEAITWETKLADMNRALDGVEVKREDRTSGSLEGYGSVGEVFGLLDYQLDTDSDRAAKLSEILGGQNYFVEYLSSEHYAYKVNPNKEDGLSDTIAECVALERMADYILFAPNRTGLNGSDEYTLESKYKRQRNENKEEGYIENGDNFDGEVDSNAKVKKVQIVSNDFLSDKTVVQGSDRVWTAQDEEDYNSTVELKDSESKFPHFIYHTLKHHQRMETRKTTEAKMKKNIVDNKVNIKYLKQLRNSGGLNFRTLKQVNSWISDLGRNDVDTKDGIRKYIRFKKLDKESMGYTFVRDTGYVNEKGQYVVVSENEVDFANVKHVKELIKTRHKMPEQLDVNGELWHLYFMLDGLIEQTELSEIERFTLNLTKTQPFDAKLLMKNIEINSGEEFTDSKVSRLIDGIALKIAEKCIESKEEWTYTYKIKGHYHFCKSCETNKLRNLKNFRKVRNKHYHKCRKCEANSKKR